MTAQSSDIRNAAINELDQRRRDLEVRPDRDTAQVKPGIEVGNTGLEVFGGIISGDIVEHNQAWMSDKRYKIADRMRRGDGTCAALLMALTLPILSTEVHVEARVPRDGSKPDSAVEDAADLVYEAMLGDHMERTFEGFLREALSLHFAYGHYPFEKVFAPIETGEFSGAMGWQEFAPRHPSTITEWNFDSNGRLKGILQEAYNPATGDIEVTPIEAGKLIMFTHQEEAGNPLGQSVFRPAWKHWTYKDGFYAVQAIAVERQGVGTPYAKYPKGTSDDDVDAAEQMLQNVQAHEQSYFVFPEDWEVGFIDMGAGGTIDPMLGVEHHDHMIVKSFLAGFLGLPQDGRGSYALSEDSSSFFTYSLQFAANHVAAVLNRKAIAQMVEYNMPNLPYYPRLRFDRVGAVELANLMEGLSFLARDGVLTPDIGLENVIRDLMNLPPVDEGTFEEAREVPEVESSSPPPASGA